MTIQTLATRIAFSRLDETCPSLRSGGTAAIAKFHAWLNRRAWIDKLSEPEAMALETRIAELVAEVIDHAQEHGTKPLRAALVAEIKENLQLHLPPSRVAAIESDTDQDADLI